MIKEMCLQIHPTNELPQILNDYSKGTWLDSLVLKKGYEYFIEVTPSGQIVSEDFKSLNYEDRNCVLSNEVPQNSTLKKHSKHNCKYECRVNIAKEKCDCIRLKTKMQKVQHARVCIFDVVRE